MIPLAHFVAISCYIGSVAVAAVPFARPVRAPFRAVLAVLAAGILAHGIGLLLFALKIGAVPLTGIGPALSSAGFLLATTLLVVEWLARDVSLTVIAAPLAAIATIAAMLLGLTPSGPTAGLRGAWLISHIAMSFAGIAAFATAGAAGAMYLIERRELKSRHFRAMFRFFPPLATLDRVNHLAAIVGWVALTVGVVLAATYSRTYRETNIPQLMWGMAAWLAVSWVALGRVLRGWQARRAAIYSSVAFTVVLVLYVALRVTTPGPGRFL
jgi:HemX protein